MTAREWTPVTKRKPCPACGGTDWCAWGHSGLLKCERQDAAPAEMVLVSKKDGGGIFRYEDDRQPEASKPRRAKPKPVPNFDGGKEQIKFLAALTPERRAGLAEALGVASWALESIGCGWATKADLERLKAWGKDWTTRPDGAFTFPERDGEGRIVGFSLRPETGAKGAFSGECGARRGIIVPDGLADMPDPVQCAEGATDVAACLSMGIAAVGRPSNASGAEDVAGLLQGRHVIVLGENDCKDHGDWPGREGAAGVAGSLSERWGKPVPWRMPPKGAKDAREWLNKRVAEGLDLGDQEAVQQAGREWMASLRDLSDSFPLPRERGGARNEFEFLSVTDLGPAQPVEWMVDGYLLPKHMTLLSAFPKTGKATWVGHQIRDLLRGEGLARARIDGPVLVVSEETEVLWQRHRAEWSLDERVRVMICPFLTKPSPAKWLELVEWVASEVRRVGSPLVVFDTLANLWCVRNENDSAEVGAAVMPLRAITVAGASLLLVHHTRKGDGQEGNATRGSSALPAMVDIITELRRTNPQNLNDRRRTLTAFSRFHETETEGVFELGKDGYRFLGDRTDIHAENRRATIESILRGSSGPMTVEEVLAKWSGELKPAEGTLRKDLNDGVGDAAWNRSGKGRKNDPYRYGFVSSTGLLLERGNESEPGEGPAQEVA